MKLTIILLLVVWLSPACRPIKVHPDFKMQDIRVGKGQSTDSSDTVLLKYKGTFVNGQIFDSSDGKTKTYSLKSPTLIDGWKVGLLGMKVGGIRRLTILPEMAFGPKGKAGRIPANSTLIFEIELHGID